MHENRLINETSPYLLQHAHQPVDWYPWGGEAFEKAAREDKPVFLSIGYSTCHWCHVMARESFDDEEVARLMNSSFVSIKVDREERPDIDSVYMAVCQAMTGSGGWPMSIFMTPDKKPFFAGTYFPKYSRAGSPGFLELLSAVADGWAHNREPLLRSAGNLAQAFSRRGPSRSEIDETLPDKALAQFRLNFDKEYGGFGPAPKFPAAHNLLFLLDRYKKRGDGEALRMAELTLQKMYAGGLFDHIGGGFSRYSTDRQYMIPHFEKMLYDNALLTAAYAAAGDVTGNGFYTDAARSTADFILREMTGPQGGFYSALDADSGGAEGLYYAFRPEEITEVLGPEGEAFNRCLGITEKGNFKGYSVPHLTGSLEEERSLGSLLPKLREYRKGRRPLSTDDKILTSWNSLMISALCRLYRAARDERYLDAAVKCESFLSANLRDGDKLYVSFRDGKRSGPGFLDDYAFYVMALLELYRTAQRGEYLSLAERLCRRAVSDFRDENGGFSLSGRENEVLIFRPRETWDGAMPSGNSAMAYDLVRLYQLTDDDEFGREADRQLRFMSGEAARAPMGCSFFLLALSEHADPPEHVVIVPGPGAEPRSLADGFPADALVSVLSGETEKYRLLNGHTTYYVCKGHACLPPVNDPAGL
jgi:uncharacterized protein YyaL (SSP411 family)